MGEVNGAAPEVGERYLHWLRRFRLRPIKTEDELDRAIETIDALSDLEERSPEEHDYMLVLASLIEGYEDARWPVAPEPEGHEASRSPPRQRVIDIEG